MLVELTDLSIDNIEEVIGTYKTWMPLYDQFLQENTQYTGLLTSDELDEYNANWFSARHMNFNEFKATMDNRFAKAALRHILNETDKLSVDIAVVLATRWCSRELQMSRKDWNSQLNLNH